MSKNADGTGWPHGRGRAADREMRTEPARRGRSEGSFHAPGSSNRLLTGAALFVQAAAYLCYSLTERAKYWRAGAVAASTVSAVAAALVWAFGRTPWIRWPIAAAFATGMPVYARIRLKSSKKTKKKRRR